MLVPATSSDKRGVPLGLVRSIRRDRIVVELQQRSIKRGDGVSFDSGRTSDDQQGGRVFDVTPVPRISNRPNADASSSLVELAFANGAIDFDQITPGMQVWKTDDPELNARLRKSFTAADPQRRTAIDLQVYAAVGTPLVVRATTETGLTCEVSSDQPAVEARQHALSEQTLRDQLDRLGGTPYALRELTATIVGRPMLPFSVLGRLRHDLVARLTEVATTPPPRQVSPTPALPTLRETPPRRASEGVPERVVPQLVVLCRSLPQLNDVLQAGQKAVYTDFSDIRQYRDAVAQARQHGASILLATPRIQKPDEIGIFHALAKHEADGLLVRNLAGLRYCHDRGIPAVADFSLNAANELTVQYLIDEGAKRVTASYDLNREQLLNLVAAVRPAWLEIVIHQHMPMFHMEHCVFCAVLSPGTNKTNCGRPCDVHQVKLRDRQGIEHPLTADVGCRNTLFNATPQSGAEIVPDLIARGINRFRLELLEESGPQITDLLDLHSRLLAGQITGKQVWSQLKATNRVGVTRGTLEERRHPLAIG
jgi:putative protease